MERRTGLEPAPLVLETKYQRSSPRIVAWVIWRGTGDAVAALTGKPPFGVRDSNPLGAVAPLPRSNRHLHHRLARCSRTGNRKQHAGEQAISVSVIACAGCCLSAVTGARGACVPLSGPLHGAGFTGGIRTRFFRREVSEIFTTSVWFSRGMRQTRCKLISCATPGTAPHARTPWSSLCHRYPACASFPPTGPALLGTRLCGASPGIRVSRSGLRRAISIEPCFGQQKTLRSGWLGRVCIEQTVDIA